MNELTWTIALGVAMGIALYRFLFSTGALILALTLALITKNETVNQDGQDNLK